jgi:sortase A
MRIARQIKMSLLMKHMSILGRLLTVLGLALLTFYGAAHILEFLLYRVSMYQFESLKPRLTNPNPTTAQAISLAPLAAPVPSFFAWSKQRIKQYEDSLTAHLEPPLAVLRIPRINIEAPVLEGTDDLTLNRGLGRIAGTAHFGETGNIGIAGHRDGFFRELKDIQLGDEIEVETPEGVSTYIVDHLQIVKPTDVQVLQSAGTPTVTLVTCYPFYFVGTAPRRFIVHAKLVSDASSSKAAI